MITTNVLWRGEPIERLNRHELSTGVVQPADINIYDVDAPEEDLRFGENQAFFGRDVFELPGDVTQREVSMTPGFTSNQGTAVHFAHYNNDEPGLIMAYNPAALPDIERVEYDIGWMHDHEGVLARIETLSNGEIRWNGRVVGLTNRGDVNAWEDRVHTRADNPTYVDEAEHITYETEVEVDPALEAVFCLVGQNSATSGSIDGALTYYDGYFKGYGRGEDAKRVDYMEPEAKLEALHEELSDQMNAYSDRLVTVLIEDQFHIAKDASLSEDDFVAGCYRGNVFERGDDPVLRFTGGNFL